MKRVLVKRVIDGDTVELADSTRVRFIGIDTPESVDPRRPVEEMGREASAYVKQLRKGKDILMQLGQTPIDRFGRTLAWLWMLDGTFINAKLVYDGYAAVYTFPDNPAHAILLTQCQADARNAQRGLWALIVAATTTTQTQPASVAGTTTPTPPTQPTPAPTTLTVTKPTGPVTKGSVATIEAQTGPGTNCSIVVQYKSGPSTAKGLDMKTTNGGGYVSWSWLVGANPTSGSWPVRIACGSQSVVSQLIVP